MIQTVAKFLANSATSIEAVVNDRGRWRLIVRGAVQGVGFRPFVFRLARELGLAGWVSNDAAGVVIEIEGRTEQLESFKLRLDRERPAPAQIHGIGQSWIEVLGASEFVIRDSHLGAVPTAWIAPDLATCDGCLRELFDPTDRRHRYPFLNCTQCGPRFSIVLGLPYDRAQTTMRSFVLCDACRREYEDPRDRRFHAQPIACPACGPCLQYWNAAGAVLAEGEAALQCCAETIRDGGIVALKGLGGFQLLADARNEHAVQRLRQRKNREAKPFALMAASLAAIQDWATVAPLEAELLHSPQAPIVLLRRRPSNVIAPAVAPGNPYLGVMLPTTPLHHLLMRELQFPIVATSGNRADEPMCIDETEALARLADIADGWLVHNRPIARHMDDSVVRVILGQVQILRRARGYAPLPILVDHDLPSVLAVGGHLKNVVGMAVGRQVVLSQHHGDLETAQAHAAFQQSVRDLPNLYQTQPRLIAFDLHPDYLSTRYAERQGLPVAPVQHHQAHVLSCLADNDLDGPALGVAWDGAGLGSDGLIWGGEFFWVGEEGMRRVAHLRPFPLPGGEAALREPRRAAFGLLYALFGEDCQQMGELPLWRQFHPNERRVILEALRRQVNTPLTTSVGRLFDAAAALAGVRAIHRYEGEAAMEWEWLADGVDTAVSYTLEFNGVGTEDPAVLDWAPLVREMLVDLQGGVSPAIMSARFHNGLIAALVQVARFVGQRRVALSGGCFLNRRLLEGAVQRLHEEGFEPCWQQRVPTGDGGLALGQIMATRFFRS